MKGGQTVLVTAAAGGTGQFVVQLAKAAGNAVVATCGADDKAALLKRLGADRVVNYRRESLKDVLRAEYPKVNYQALTRVDGLGAAACMSRFCMASQVFLASVLLNVLHAFCAQLQGMKEKYTCLPETAALSEYIRRGRQEQ